MYIASRNKKNLSREGFGEKKKRICFLSKQIAIPHKHTYIIKLYEIEF